MLRPERELLAKAGDFATPADAILWIIGSELYNHSRCRAWAMKRHCEGLVKKGIPKMDALVFTAEEFCVDPKTVEKAVYCFKDL